MNDAKADAVARSSNPLTALERYGQSPWLDYIHRNLVKSGELERMMNEHGLKGVTSNPAIFEKAIAGSDDYGDLLAAGRGEKLAAEAIYERIAVRDIRDAADTLRPVYEASDRRDGYVSLEVSPRLAHITAETVVEACRLWRDVARPNLMIKVPATAAGIPAVRSLIAEGINVNVTLIFAREVYREVARAYIDGLATRLTAGHEIRGIASVASFFVSRIDTAVDAEIDRLAQSGDAERQIALRSLRGKTAIANAKLAYADYREIISGVEWGALAGRGARTQRLLWASTGTKNPAYSDVLYVEELIGPDTVNTMPPATLEAFRDHGRLRASLTEDPQGASNVMAALDAAGISLARVTERLLDEGVTLFAEAFDKLLAAIAQRTA